MCCFRYLSVTHNSTSQQNGVHSPVLLEHILSVADSFSIADFVSFENSVAEKPGKQDPERSTVQTSVKSDRASTGPESKSATTPSTIRALRNNSGLRIDI